MWWSRDLFSATIIWVDILSLNVSAMLSLHVSSPIIFPCEEAFLTSLFSIPATFNTTEIFLLLIMHVIRMSLEVCHSTESLVALGTFLGLFVISLVMTWSEISFATNEESAGAYLYSFRDWNARIQPAALQWITVPVFDISTPGDTGTESNWFSVWCGSWITASLSTPWLGGYKNKSCS